MEIGALIKNRRIELDLSQKEVADAVGVSESTISRWESGNIQNMKRSRIAALSKILRLSLGEITDGEEDAHGDYIPTDDDIKFALFGGGGEITDVMYDEVRSFAEFVKKKYERGS